MPRTTSRSAPSRARTSTGSRRTSAARRRVAVARLVEDDTGVLAAEHAAHDERLLDLLERLSA